MSEEKPNGKKLREQLKKISSNAAGDGNEYLRLRSKMLFWGASFYARVVLDNKEYTEQELRNACQNLELNNNESTAPWKTYPNQYVHASSFLYADGDVGHIPGITMRQHLASMALQGILSGMLVYNHGDVSGGFLESMAKFSVEAADALIKELS